MVEEAGLEAVPVDPGRLVRRAVEEDAGSLAFLRWTWRSTERGEVGLASEEFGAAFAQWYRGHRDTHTAFVAEVGGVAVGMAWLAIIERVPGPEVWRRLAGHLQSVYVVADRRGRGLGAALVLAAIDEAVERGFDYVFVHPSQRSFPFYRRLGFHETGAALEIDLKPRRRRG